MQPGLVAHADWSTSPPKRWMARATLQENGRYHAHAPEPVGETYTLVERMRAAAGPDGCALLGFDFPIGLPAAYAARAGIDSFRALLPGLGQGEWADFYTVAERPAEISLRRPFYPQRPGETSQAHLIAGLGVGSLNDLRRRCDLAYAGRRAASPIFWTLGGQQVGKAAIAGWKELLAPALRSDTLDVALWPFDGDLFELFRPGRVVIVETYPAEYYGHLHLSFSASRAGEQSGKRTQRDRQANAPALVRWADDAGVDLSPDLRSTIQDGFGASADGEDPFDATVGLFGMLNVVLGRRLPWEPEDPRVRSIEGWMLGQADPSLPGSSQPSAGEAAAGDAGGVEHAADTPATGVAAADAAGAAPGEAPWYLRFFGPRYLATYADTLTDDRTRGEVEFIERTLALSPGEAVLDAACGHGRHLAQLAARGYRMTGVDLDEYALGLARETIRQQGAPDDRVRLLRCDLREIPYVEEFDAAYNYFTAFGYLETEAEDERALRAMARALRPGGRFLLETMSMYRLAQAFQPRTWHDTSTGYRVLEERSWDLLAGRMRERRVIREPDGTEHEERIDLRLYSASELARLFERAGLTVEAALSAPDGGPYTLRSFRLALFGRKHPATPS